MALARAAAVLLVLATLGPPRRLHAQPPPEGDPPPASATDELTPTAEDPAADGEVDTALGAATDAATEPPEPAPDDASSEETPTDPPATSAATSELEPQEATEAPAPTDPWPTVRRLPANAVWGPFRTEWRLPKLPPCVSEGQYDPSARARGTVSLQSSWIRARWDGGIRLDLDFASLIFFCRGGAVHRGIRSGQPTRVELRAGPFGGATVGSAFAVGRLGLVGSFALYRKRWALVASLRAAWFGGTREPRPDRGPETRDLWGFEAGGQVSYGVRLTPVPVYVAIAVNTMFAVELPSFDRTFGTFGVGISVEAPW